MYILTAPPAGIQMFREMKELAKLPSAAQRYIRRSLDVAFERWDRLDETTQTEEESESVGRQARLYSKLGSIRAAIPTSEDETETVRFISMTAELTAFDLAQGKIRSFAAYRFLYERLLGAAARPWLLSVFATCASLAPLSPQLRTDLLRSIDEQAVASNHSKLEPRFQPEWVDRLEG
jgi:hypothetical protein